MATDFDSPEYVKQTEEPRLVRLFGIARKQFFPRWDLAQQWRIVAECRKGTGYCESKEKRIYIDPFGVRRMPDDGLLALIIHEICHDVATSHHREPWLERMEQAAKKAESLEQPELAHKIRASAYSHIPSGTPWHEKWCKYFSPFIEAHKLSQRENRNGNREI